MRPSVWLIATLMTWSSESRRIAAQVLAHAVEDHDRVVGREAGDRQQRGDDVQRQVVAEEGEERERHQQVVHRRDDGADREAQLKAERDVGQDADQRQHGRPDALARQLARRPPARRSRCPARLKLPRLAACERRFDLLRRLARAMRPIRRRPAARGSSSGAATDRRTR